MWRYYDPAEPHVYKALELELDKTLKQYQKSFTSKAYSEENDDHDLLMDAFGIEI